MRPTMDQRLLVDRTFDATPAEMWDAWTEPERYARWSDAAGAGLVIRTFDARPGGKLRYDAPRPDGGKDTQDDVFHEVDAPSRLVMGSPDRHALVAVRIEPRGRSRCHVAVEVTGLSPDHHARASEDWRRRFDQLEVDLARSTPIEGQSVTLDRVFDCTQEEMWDAWTDVKQYAHWISPFPALDAEVHEFDPRVGGRSRFTMIGTKGERYPETSFLFLKVEKPREIQMFEANRDRPDAFDGHPMLLHARFDALEAERTRLVLVVSGFPKEFPAEVAGQGFGASLDKLAAMLAAQK